MLDAFEPLKAAQNNAKRALAMRAEQHPSNRGMTAVGLKRMAAFRRHQGNYKEGEPTKGTQAWLGWGGEAGVKWAEQIVEIERRKRERNKRI